MLFMYISAYTEDRAASVRNLSLVPGRLSTYISGPWLVGVGGGEPTESPLLFTSDRVSDSESSRMPLLLHNIELHTFNFRIKSEAIYLKKF